MKKLNVKLGCLAIAATAFVAGAQATEVFQNTSLTVGYSDSAKPDAVFGTGSKDEKQTSLRFEHFGVNGLGDNYFFADNYSGKEVGGASSGSFGTTTDRQQFFVWNGRLSLAKAAGVKFDGGLIEDVSLMYRMERGSYANYQANMVGPSINLKVPGAAWFQTSFLMNKQEYAGSSSDYNKGHLFWHTFAIFPFEAAGQKFTFSPLVWKNMSKDSGTGSETYIEPDLWMKAGDSGLDVGFRYQYHKTNSVSRTTPTLLARVNF